MFRKKNNKTNKPAFTLVELLVVIAIIGVLATLAMVSIQSARIKARDTKRIADIKQIQTALELFFNDNGLYPASTSVTSSINSGTKVYMEVYPQAPTPPDGDCTEESNQYVYTEAGEDNGSYSVSFCIGSQSANLNSGDKCATPMGILNSSCSGEEEGVPEEEEEEEVFVCGESTVSYQSYDYATVQIGSQCWFEENLRSSKLNDNTDIPNVTGNSAWASLTTPGYCWYNNDYATYGAIHGALYNFYAVDSGKLCPAGWRVPTDDDFKALELFAGMNSGELNNTGWRGIYIGSKLKISASNETGFSALFSGRRFEGGVFDLVNGNYFVWSSSDDSGTNGCYRALSSANTYIFRYFYYKDLGYSVRCIEE